MVRILGKKGEAMFKGMRVFVVVAVAGTLVLASDKMKDSEEVYVEACSACHGVMGEGNPKVPDAPALGGLTKDELVGKLSSLKEHGFDSLHERMGENLEKLERRGLKFDNQEMAEYISTQLCR